MLSATKQALNLVGLFFSFFYVTLTLQMFIWLDHLVQYIISLFGRQQLVGIHDALGVYQLLELPHQGDR